MQLMMGDQVGPYRVERIECRNDNDVVIALNDSTGTRIAIKVYSPMHPRDLRQDQRFCQAVTRWQELDCPYLVRILGQGKHWLDHTPFAFMELLSGGTTLRQELDQGAGRLAESAALRVAHQLAMALQSLDRAHLVHRDLTPDNVLLIGNDVKVIDFATAVDRSAPDDTVSAVGRWPGDMCYTAPELLSGHRPLRDGRSDIYSLGCVLYELLAGRPPFPRAVGRSSSELEDAALRCFSAAPPPLWSVDPLLSRSVVDLVEALMAPEPAQRPDAREVCARLATISSESDLTLREYQRRAGGGRIYETMQIGRRLADALIQHHRELDPDHVFIQPNRITVGQLNVGLLYPKNQDGAYRSPESWQGVSSDGAEDVYSLGVILYELLAGAPPFESSTLAGLTRLHMESPPPSLRGHVPATTPPELLSLIYRMLTKNASLRPPLAQIRELLDALLAPLPTRMGPYSIVRRLGRGGSAQVYEVFENPAQHLALKVLHDRSPQHMKRFAREYHALAERDPGVVAVYDRGVLQTGEPYLLTEYLDGESLHDRLCRLGHLPASEVVRLGHQLATTLVSLHARRLLHRDLKPRNIMLVGVSQEKAKLIDFGIVKVLDGEAITAIGEFLGTTDYAAPEQCNAASVTAACDVYSLGVVLYEAATGTHPLARRYVGPTDPRAQAGPAIPPPLLSLLRRMQDVSPQRRPSMSEVRDELTRLHPHDGPPPPPPPPPEQRFLVGQSIGSFTLLGMLHDRRASAVFTARRSGEERIVVVKVIYPHALLSYSAAHRLLDRGRQLRNLAPEGTIESMEVEQLHDGTLYGVMEYEPSLTLAQHLLQSGGRLALDQAAALFASTAEAMGRWHHEQLVHGALTPENLLLCGAPSNASAARTVKLLYFHLQRPLLRLLEEGALDNDEVALRYAAPELCYGTSPTRPTNASDVYALGVMIFEALAGHNPFAASTPAATLRRHQEHKPSLLTDHLKSERGSERWSMAQKISLLVDQALRKDPRERPPMVHIALQLASLVHARRIGSYWPLRLLGQGGMGQVYDVVHAETGERRALKLLLASCLQEKEAEDLLRRFKNEAKAVQQVNHRGVVQIFEVCETAEQIPFLVMERLFGRSLRELLVNQQPPDVLWFAEQLSAVMAACHEKKVAHRDLKPENIFLEWTADGEPQIKVLDFGIAQIRGDNASPLEQTKSGAPMMGSPKYMAPEQWYGIKGSGKEADVYALGVILYEVVTGEAPFQGSAPALGRMHIEEPAPRLSDVVRGTHAVLDELVFQMMAKKSERRPTMQLVHDTVRDVRSLHEQTTLVRQGVTIRMVLPSEGEYGLLQRVAGWFRRRISG